MRQQRRRIALTEHGHMLIACQFSKGMNEAQVACETFVAFGEKIPPLLDRNPCQYMPSLAPRQQGITGISLNRLFKNKPVNVPLSKVLSPGLLQVRL